MKKLGFITVAFLFVINACPSVAAIIIDENTKSAVSASDQHKKKGVAVEKVQKIDQKFKEKKKADVNVKKIKKSSACCEPDPIMPSPSGSVGKGR